MQKCFDLLTCLVCLGHCHRSSITSNLGSTEHVEWLSAQEVPGALSLQSFAFFLLSRCPALTIGKYACKRVAAMRLSEHFQSMDFLQEKRLLRGVILEAIEAQEKKHFALEQQLIAESRSDDGPDDDKAEKKARRRAEQIPIRLAETNASTQRLFELKTSLSQPEPNLTTLRTIMESEMGLATRLETFDPDAKWMQQWGRPNGFDGLVIESDRGIPILVSRSESFSDPLLRRVARGSDLWFQVRSGSGSRVLLRTSMVKRFKKSPRECMEMAADLAAYFSGLRGDEKVEVMVTDSRHVAKRGGRVGQMKWSKRLQSLWAQPHRQELAAREAQEEQGWIPKYSKRREPNQEWINEGSSDECPDEEFDLEDPRGPYEHMGFEDLWDQWPNEEVEIEGPWYTWP